MNSIDHLQQCRSCRLVEFENAELHPLSTTGHPILVVGGTRPCVNMEVQLVPLVYVDQPEYWGIEVVGCLPDGICLPAQSSFQISLSLANTIGTKGIEVIGHARSLRIDSPVRAMNGGGASEAEQRMRDLLRRKQSSGSIVHSGVSTGSQSLSEFFGAEDYDAILNFLETGQSGRPPFEGRSLVVPGRPDESIFYIQITSGVMAGQFDPDDVKVVADWINSLA